MMRRWLRRNWLALVISLIVLGGFATLYNNWLAFSAFAMLLLALAAFWTIWDNRQTRREERKREHTARSADELCGWAEEALRLYYLPYNYHKDEIKDGLSNLIVKNMVMVIAATIIGDEFIEPTKRAERALAEFYGIIKQRYYNKVTKPVSDATLKEFESAFYSLLTYLYVLRYWDYDYQRFLDDAIENGMLKSKYQLRSGGDMDNSAEDKTNNTGTDDTLVKLSKQVGNSERGAWFRFLLSLGFAMMAIGLGIAFSSPQYIESPLKSILSWAIIIVGITVVVKACLWYSPHILSKKLAKSSITVLSLGAIIMMVDALLKTEFGITVSLLLLSGIVIVVIGVILIFISLKTLRIRI